MVSARNVSWRQKPCYRLATSGFLLFMLGGFLAHAADSTGASDYAAYLAQHQGELAPFFSAQGSDIFKNGLPILVAIAGRILLATALAGWLIDILLAWGFATIFAPAYAKFPRSLVYACGRLALALMLTTVLMFAAMIGINAGAGLPALLIVAVLTVPAVFAQVFWVGYLFRTRPTVSVVFYTALLGTHALIGAILVPTVFAREVNVAISSYVNQSVVPALRTEAEKAEQNAAGLTAMRDATQARVAKLQARIAQDQADENNATASMEQAKNAPAVLFSRLVLLRAQGNLAEAGKGLADFIAKYPNDPDAGAARGQLNEVSQALAAQATLSRQEQARNAQAVALARRRLLQDADAGRATLSEMREALLDKSTQEVADLLGAPSETGANKWGYGKRMILDPDRHERRGLTVTFAEGRVQGVDYYYGDTQ